MTKRIFRSIFSVSAVILVISIGLIMGLLYGHFGDQLKKELKQEAVYLAIAVENDGLSTWMWTPTARTSGPTKRWIFEK